MYGLWQSPADCGPGTIFLRRDYVERTAHVGRPAVGGVSDPVAAADLNLKGQYLALDRTSAFEGSPDREIPARQAGPAEIRDCNRSAECSRGWLSKQVLSAGKDCVL